MITVAIAGETRDISDASESWINQQINRRRKDGFSVCVVITINTSGVNVTLSTPGCSVGFGGGRAPNANEREVFELWDKRGLNRPDFTAGNLIAFLKQIWKAAA
jgi:hypothetical protein